ncbi:hypothetical protein DXG03_003423 [Asterophora parasitica]|uniref:Uncharacterized protein n=1 Tax=Asterophora parasitica TaxID=117018 RepID=A0A9P7FYR7_9AGAR|nr:hypothetical protein DXG03_003423 [Asterophora parasitica]
MQRPHADYSENFYEAGPAPSKGPHHAFNPASIYYPTPPLTAPSSLQSTPTLPPFTFHSGPDESDHRSHATHHRIFTPPSYPARHIHSVQPNDQIHDHAQAAQTSGYIAHGNQNLSQPPHASLQYNAPQQHAAATGQPVDYITQLNPYLSQPSHASSPYNTPSPTTSTSTSILDPSGTVQRNLDLTAFTVTRLANDTLKLQTAPSGVQYLQYTEPRSTFAAVDSRAALQGPNQATPGPSYAQPPASTSGSLGCARTKAGTTRRMPYPQAPSTRQGSAPTQVKRARHCDACNVTYVYLPLA